MSAAIILLTALLSSTIMGSPPSPGSNASNLLDAKCGQTWLPNVEYVACVFNQESNFRIACSLNLTKGNGQPEQERTAGLNFTAERRQN
ncbi:hypothetical protein T265_12166 [Opisthorchis viverrini]|uniref:Uncharacterized protein n=1 Tax=Opisthorchis viverrini TaxID=6198 RepID=A0A074YVG7_OPIVI|nr:hypothetical protein T265_12166 [Opisthorchis viverrini]KER18761.1 hypothetical protein T265_12166 [Opisthorchis viverrini]